MSHEVQLRCFCNGRRVCGACFPFQVCELDIIFNFEKAYFILDEFLMGGEVQETSKVTVSLSVEEADTLQEVL